MEQENLIRSLREENEALRAENAKLQKRIQQDYMERIIKDDQLSQQISNHVEEFYPEPLAPWYVCILFYGSRPLHEPPRSKTENKPPESPREKVMAAFGDTLENYGQAYFFEISGTVACLLNVELEETLEDTPEVGRAFCTELRDALSETHRHSYKQTAVSHIAISHAGRMEQGPRFLYRSAISVAERRTQDSPAVCMENELVIPAREPLVQVLTLEPTFWRQIQQRAFYDAATTFDQLLQLTSLEQGSLERTSSSVFTRMEVVLQVIVQENGGNRTHDPVVAELLSKLSGVKTYQEMREVAYDILATLEDRFCTPPNARNRKMANIEAYIMENYRDQLMCATSIADAFKISPSYLSRIFKADMGIGIIEYIHNLRVNAAKELLKDDSLTIDAVAVRAGFSNRWVLTRVFKKIVGTTPGAYRSNSGS